MLFRFKPLNFVSKVTDEAHISRLLRDKNYEVVEQAIPEVIVTELPKDVVLFDEPEVVIPVSEDVDTEVKKKLGRPKKVKHRTLDEYQHYQS